MVDTVIGVISSTEFNTKFETAFKSGITDAGVSSSAYTLAKRNANGAYDDAGQEDLHKQIHGFVKELDKINSGVRIFVTVGGLVTAHAAFKRAKNKPFLVLVGGKPGD